MLKPRVLFTVLLATFSHVAGAEAKTTPGPSACTALQSALIAPAVIGEATGGAVVTSATYVSAAADAPSPDGKTITPAAPDYCLVLVDVRPIDPMAPPVKVRVNLPTRWNGKALQFGGAGFNGTLVTGTSPAFDAGPGVKLPLAQGYMTAGTDSGHQNAPGTHPAAFALNSEALTNFAYGAYKKTHDVAARLTRLYYGRAPRNSYYMGGSEGGREGLTMAQRYPRDFDGIISVDPVIAASALWTQQNSFGGLQAAPESWLGGKTQLVQDTVAGACDALDGLADHVVSNYIACTAPMVMTALSARRCASGHDEGAQCFSDGQLNVLRAAYAGYTFPFALANGITAYPGYVPGSEGVPNNFAFWVTGAAAPTSHPDDTPGIGRSYLYGSWYVRYFIARDPMFDARHYNPADYRARVQDVSQLFDATDPDLSAFYAHGGKLILREDLGDKGQSALAGLRYRDAVAARMGTKKADRFFAAYVATGLGHTSPGLDAGTANAPVYGTPGHADLLALLDKWVAKGVMPPRQVILENRQPLPPYAVIASRPMCRYGAYPKFMGSGGGDQARDYACTR